MLEEERESSLSSEYSASSSDWIDLEKEEETKTQINDIVEQNANRQSDTKEHHYVHDIKSGACYNRQSTSTEIDKECIWHTSHQHTKHTAHDKSSSCSTDNNNINSKNVNTNDNVKIEKGNDKSSITTVQTPFDVRDTSMLRGLSIYYSDPFFNFTVENKDLHHRSRHHHHHELAPVIYELFVYSCNAKVNIYNEDVLHNNKSNNNQRRGQLCHYSKQNGKHKSTLLRNVTTTHEPVMPLTNIVDGNSNHPKLVLEISGVKCQLDQFAFGAEEKR